jgi:hypothetical protein
MGQPPPLGTKKPISLTLLWMTPLGKRTLAANVVKRVALEQISVKRKTRNLALAARRGLQRVVMQYPVVI